MKNSTGRRLGGFTLIELLVVVLILGILASMALPQYFKAVERSRMSEVVVLFNNIAQAQRRKQMQTNAYVSHFEGLDVAPKGASGAIFYTKGDPVNGTNCNGFRTYLEGPFIYAERFSSSGNLQYSYAMWRYYDEDVINCQGRNSAGKELCADFCGVDAVRSSDGMCCSDGRVGGCS